MKNRGNCWVPVKRSNSPPQYFYPTLNNK